MRSRSCPHCGHRRSATGTSCSMRRRGSDAGKRRRPCPRGAAADGAAGKAGGWGGEAWVWANRSSWVGSRRSAFGPYNRRSKASRRCRKWALSCSAAWRLANNSRIICWQTARSSGSAGVSGGGAAGGITPLDVRRPELFQGLREEKKKGTCHCHYWRCLRGRGTTVAVPSPHAVPIHAVEQHGQLGGADLDAARSFGRREVEGSLFQPLVPDGQPVAVPVQDLEPVAALVAEHEEMARQRVTRQE